MIEVFTLGAALATLLVSVVSLVLLRRSSPEASCKYRWCWRRATAFQEHNVPAGALPDEFSGASATVPLCRKHEAKFDKSEIEQQFRDRFGGGDSPA